jgi:hypothetical protein
MLVFIMEHPYICFSYDIRTGKGRGDPFYSKWAELFVHELGPQHGDKLEVLASELKGFFPTASIKIIGARKPSGEPNNNIVI